MAVRLLLGDATRVLCSEELQRDSLWTTAAHAQLASVGKILAKTESEAEERQWAIDGLLIGLWLPAGSLHAVLVALHCPMSHTARQALTIFQQWLIAEFKTLSESLKRSYVWRGYLPCPLSSRAIVLLYQQGAADP